MRGGAFIFPTQTVDGVRVMRKAFAKAVLFGGALAASFGQPVSAGFHHRVVGTYPCAIITPSPNVYGDGYAIAPCPPNPVPRGCWLGRHLGFGHFGRLAWGGYGCGRGYGACGVGGCDTCGDGSCGAAGCDGGNCDVGSQGSAATTSSERVTNEKIISDRPAGDAPVGEAAPDPVPDKSTSVSRGSAFRLTGMKQNHAGAVDFNKGVTAFRTRQLNDALASFEAAIAAEPDNAVYQYYLAMTLFGLSGPEAGQEALSRAVELEQQEPIADWGKRMEREQGRGRAWVEKARRDAGITK